MIEYDKARHVKAGGTQMMVRNVKTKKLTVEEMLDMKNRVQ